jgi:hypothetical protein
MSNNKRINMAALPIGIFLLKKCYFAAIKEEN